MPKLYHASREHYSVGQRIGPVPETLFSQRRRDDPHYAEVEDLFERMRPDGRVSRRKAMFACSSPDESAAIAQGESSGRIAAGNSPISYYRVKMTNPTKAPMFLVDHVARLGGPPETLESIATEYWNPQEPWSFWEFLDTEMEIVKVVPEPDLIAVARARLSVMNEYDLRKKVFGRIVR